MLKEHLESSLATAFKSLHGKLQTITTLCENDANKTALAVFLLRILRELRADLPDLESLKSFGLSIIPQLHDILIKSIVAEPTKFLAKSFHRKRVIGKLLWEGEPALPVQPSPSIFKFVHSLNSTMAAMGCDLWSPTAVGVLKKQLRAEIGRLWSEAITAEVPESGEVNGTYGKGDSASGEEEAPNGNGQVAPASPTQDYAEDNDILMQSLFDILVLGLFLGLSDKADDNGLQGLETNLMTRLSLGKSENQRLQQSSLEYWKRTNLMFGLLL